MKEITVFPTYPSDPGKENSETDEADFIVHFVWRSSLQRMEKMMNTQEQHNVLLIDGAYVGKSTLKNGWKMDYNRLLLRMQEMCGTFSRKYYFDSGDLNPFHNVLKMLQVHSFLLSFFII